MHLLADWPQSDGVPWLFRRHSLAMWTSGSFEVLIIVLSWAACAPAGRWHAVGGQHTGNMFRALSTLI